jgi:raffinose/stachyose/melibiose transport system substrate-binding protein
MKGLKRMVNGSLFLVLVTMVACSSNKSAEPVSSQPASSAGSSSPSNQEKVKIVFMSRNSGADPMAKIYEKQIAEFMQQNPNITVQNDSIYDEGAYNNKLKVAISTGKTPNIFYYPAIAGLTSWAKNGVIMDLTDTIKSDPEWTKGFIEGSLDTYRLDKYGVPGIYALNNEMNVDVVFYNKKLFEKAGITQTPKTMDEFYQDINKLKASGITPFGVGGKDTWVMGHVFNNVLFKRIGLEGIMDLGTRKKTWTDPDVVESLKIVKDLKAKGAFAEGFEGMDYNTEITQFINGESAMITHSSPFISDLYGSDSKIKEDISFFPFPYFTDKPQFENTKVIYSSSLMLSGTMGGAEKDASVKLLKYITRPESIQERMDILRIAPRKDVTPKSDAPKIFQDMIAYTASITKSGGEYFEYDPDPALVDRSRNTILDMMLSLSPEDAAKAIQQELDNYDASTK